MTVEGFIKIRRRHECTIDCEIHDTPYCGIVGGGDNAIYEDNLIYRVMRMLHDGAAIYAGFNSGMIMRGNVVRDITNNGGYGASAYYLDEQSKNCVVEDNLSVDVERPTQNHMAHGNILRNNVFIMSGDCSTYFARCDGYTLERNIYYAQGDIQFHAPVDGIVNMSNNILYSAKGKVEWEDLVQYSGQGLKPYVPSDGTVVANPLFVNLKNGDYRFRPGSPAYRLGIKPLDFSHAGLLHKRSKPD